MSEEARATYEKSQKLAAERQGLLSRLGKAKAKSEAPSTQLLKSLNAFAARFNALDDAVKHPDDRGQWAMGGNKQLPKLAETASAAPAAGAASESLAELAVPKSSPSALYWVGRSSALWIHANDGTLDTNGAEPTRKLSKYRTKSLKKIKRYNPLKEGEKCASKVQDEESEEESEQTPA